MRNQSALLAAIKDYKAAKSNPHALPSYYKGIIKQVCRLSRHGFVVTVERVTKNGAEYACHHPDAPTY